MRADLTFFRAFWLPALLLWLGVVSALAGNEVTIRFPVPAMQMEAGRSKMIAFTRANKNLSAAQFTAAINPPDQAEVLLPGRILEKQPVGYLQIRPLKAGLAVLEMGGARLTLRIAEATAPPLVAQPRIVSPLSGAAIWGEVAVAAECLVPDAAQVGAVLHLPDNTDLFPQPNEDQGPDHHFIFLLDASHLPPGENELRMEVLRKDQPSLPAPPVRVNVIAPTELLLADECENTIATPRPESNQGEPKTMPDPAASGGVCVQNYGQDPIWLTSVQIPQAGEYQMILVSRGDSALGAYPTIKLCVDDTQKPLTNGRVPDKVWRRSPLGLPIHLDAGQHLLGARYDNDFYESKVDRNLYLDRYELAKINTPSDHSNAAGFQIEFNRIFDQKTIQGPVLLTAKCLLAEKNSAQFPDVELWLNDTKVAVERGPALAFSVAAGNFKAGQNVLQLRARDGAGRWVESAPQRLLLQHPAPPPVPAAFYFTMFDRGWDQTMEPRHEKDDHERLADTAAWYWDDQSILRLPDALSGTFDVDLMARGQWFNGLPVAEIALRIDGRETRVLKAEIKQDWNENKVGQLDLPAGAKELVVRFTNDNADGEKGDRNFWLRWIKLQAPVANPALPDVGISIKYSPGLQPIGLTDAIVADFFAPAGLTSADLLIDDRPQNLNVDLSKGLGPVFLPLLTRSLAPGSHRVKIVAVDETGRKTESAVQEIHVEASRAPSAGTYGRAVRLLDRLGFGANPADLTPLLVLGPGPWLARSLQEDDGRQAAVRAAVQQQVNGDDLIRQVLSECVLDPDPVRQRFVLWAENHFSTWIEKTGRENKRSEHEAFGRIGVAPFPDLLLTSATSPAMLVYLDQQRSFAGRINENYAREIMELHTLGVKGGYNQDDVTSLAGLLTGWSTAEEGDLEGTGGDLIGEFRYDPKLNSGAATEILGLDFPAAAPAARFERVRLALDTLAAHPSAGEFISRKLLEHYVSNPAPPALVQELANLYTSTGGDLRAMLTAIADSPAFLQSPPRVATPLDFSLRVARAIHLRDTGSVADFLRRSGMGLFDHVSPDGYPQSDASYVSSNALLQRWKFGQKIENQLLTLIPDSWRTEKKLSVEQTQSMLDLAATRLLGTCLAGASNQAAVQLLASAPLDGDARARLIVRFLCQAPEAGLR